MDNNLSGPRPDQRLITGSGDVEAGEMPVKGSNRSERTAPSAAKAKAVDPSGSDTPLASTSDQAPSPELLQIPPSLSFTSPTPETSPFRPSVFPSQSKFSSGLQIPDPMKTPTRASSDKSKGKRKVDDVEITPPDHKKEAQRATFAPVDPRRKCCIPLDSLSTFDLDGIVNIALRVSDASRGAPSSYQNKRARISSPLPTPSHSRPASTSQQMHTYGSWSSRASSPRLYSTSYTSHTFTVCIHSFNNTKSSAATATNS